MCESRLFKLLVSVFFVSVVLASAARPPNIIIVMTDDQGFPNLGFNGHPVLKTPNVDSFAESAIRLTDYHVDPSCAPTRAALLTGRYSDRVGVWHTVMGRSFLRARETTMADIFSQAGYATGIFGKWHLGDAYPFRPEDRGFQQTVIHSGGGVGQTPDFWGNDYFDDVYRVNGEMKQFKGFCTDVFFAEAKHFIKTSAEKGKPFLVYLVPNAPHGPFYAKAADAEKVAKRLDKSDFSRFKNEALVNYFAMIENIDLNFGQLRDFLRENRLEENTILVYSSDNGQVLGDKLYNAGLRGSKVSHYDGGHTVPWIMRWPKGGLSKGADITPVTAHVDILPTLLELAGVKSPDIHFDGKSLVPLLRDPKTDWPQRTLVVENQRVVDPIKYRNSAVMTDEWRLIGNEQEKFELYKKQNDRGQEKDVSKQYPEVMESMKKSYDDFWDDVSKDHALVSRMIIGSEHQNPVTLTAHDWLGNTLWHQKHIRNPEQGDYGNALGHWEVNVAEDGWYQISLRRWPAEADRAISDPYVGTGYSVKNAVLEIQGQKLEMPVGKNDREITFRVQLKKGDAKIETRFLGGDTEISAFYAYILREENGDKKGWQTREGLGLPLAVWPDVPGKDPYAD